MPLYQWMPAFDMDYYHDCANTLTRSLAKMKPNQSLQITNRTYTECEPNRTFRASAVLV